MNEKDKIRVSNPHSVALHDKIAAIIEQHAAADTSAKLQKAMLRSLKSRQDLTKLLSSQIAAAVADIASLEATVDRDLAIIDALTLDAFAHGALPEEEIAAAKTKLTNSKLAVSRAKVAIYKDLAKSTEIFSDLKPEDVEDTDEDNIVTIAWAPPSFDNNDSTDE